MQPDYYANGYTASQIDSGAAAAAGGFIMMIMLFWLVLVIIMIIAQWKIFTKAGKPGWASLIPIYNIYVLLQIAQKPWWWLLLFFVPIASFVVAILTMVGLGRAFGKGAAWSIILLLIFSPIGMLMLAFGKSQYQYGQVNPQPTAQPTSEIPTVTP